MRIEDKPAEMDLVLPAAMRAPPDFRITCRQSVASAIARLSPDMGPGFQMANLLPPRKGWI